MRYFFPFRYVRAVGGKQQICIDDNVRQIEQTFIADKSFQEVYNKNYISFKSVIYCTYLFIEKDVGSIFFCLYIK